jgi:hypothetical protein
MTALKFKKKKAVTLEHFKLEPDRPRYFKFTGPIEVAPQATSRRPKDGEQQPEPTKANKMAPPELATVIDLETGKEGQIICNAVLASSLNDAYPGDAYVGKCFEITMVNLQGKSYKGFHITEIDVETDGETEVRDGADKTPPRKR